MGAALYGSAIPTVRADAEATRLVGLIQLARETAIMRQRDIEMRFDDRSVRLIRTEDGVEVPLAEVRFEYTVGLRQFADQGDTGDGYGSDGPADFGDATRLYFISDGSLVDQTSVPVSGTFFMGMENQPSTARAVTITGPTARPRQFRWMTGSWVPR